MEDLQTKIVDALRDHCTYNAEAQKTNMLFSKILCKIPELRTLSQEGIQRLAYLKQHEEQLTKPPPFVQQVLLGKDLPF